MLIKVTATRQLALNISYYFVTYLLSQNKSLIKKYFSTEKYLPESKECLCRWIEPCSSNMKVPASPLLSLLLCLVTLSSPLSAQNSFSPFSLLNSWLSSVPGWPLPPSTPQARPHHQRSAGLSSVQTKQKQKFFRPHLKLSPSISSSQVTIHTETQELIIN